MPNDNEANRIRINLSEIPTTSEVTRVDLTMGPSIRLHWWQQLLIRFGWMADPRPLYIGTDEAGRVVSILHGDAEIDPREFFARKNRN